MKNRFVWLPVMAWCIMPNHYHLAVRTGSVPLWRSIRSLQLAYLAPLTEPVQAKNPAVRREVSGWG